MSPEGIWKQNISRSRSKKESERIPNKPQDFATRGGGHVYQPESNLKGESVP